MDHDDEIFPEALRRMYEYAAANNADILLGKEVMFGDSRTPGWPTWRRNQPSVEVGHEVLHCMTPHKLYRRSLVEAASVRFPEGPIRFEDQYFNHAAYAVADKIAILADYPSYRWWMHGQNNHRAEVDLDIYMSSFPIPRTPAGAGPRFPQG